MFDELKQQCAAAGHGGFLPAIKQIANVAALPGIVQGSMGMPDLHSGYGFTIGGVAAFDCDDPEAVVSPGGVGFDINCGVRLLRTNLFEKDISEHRETAQQLFDHIPVGVGSRGVIPTSASALDAALELGMDWSFGRDTPGSRTKNTAKNMARCCLRIRPKYLDERRSEDCRSSARSARATTTARFKLWMKSMTSETLGGWALGKRSSGRHDPLWVSRIGHQVATDAALGMERAAEKDPGLKNNDRQLACARIQSEEGQDYLKSMAAAANYAWVNRSSMTFW